VIQNSGEGAESAIQIVTEDTEDKINGEYWYLHYQYGKSWETEMQMVTAPDANGRRFDILHIRFDNGQRKILYFLL